MSGQRVIERRLHEALHDVAVATVPDSRIPPALPDGEQSPHRRRRFAAVLTVAAAVVAIALVGVLARSGDAPGPHRTPSSLSVAAPSTGAQRPAKVVVGEFCDNFVLRGCARPRYQPLWPYTSYTQASRYRTGRPASQAWRHSPSAVGNRYLRVLGYTGITVVGGDPGPAAGPVGVSFGMHDDAHHSVGGLDLETYGTTTAAPYEVDGVPTFTHAKRMFGFDLPRRVDKVAGTFTVRGRHAAPGAIVRIRTLSVTTVISTVRVHADATGHWTASVSAAGRGVTTVAADSRGTRSAPRQLVIMGYAHA